MNEAKRDSSSSPARTPLVGNTDGDTTGHTGNAAAVPQAGWRSRQDANSQNPTSGPITI